MSGSFRRVELDYFGIFSLVSTMNNCIHRSRTLASTLLLSLAISCIPACSQAPAQTSGTLVGQAPKIADGEDWAAFLGPKGNGYSSEKGLDTSLWKPHPPIVWELRLGVSYGGPSIVGDKLYQFDRVGDKERLSCYDLATAKALWFWESGSTPYRDPYGYNNGPRCSPIIDGELIYVYGVTGNLYCINATSHKLVWKKETFTEYGVVPNFFGVASNPVVFEDKLIVMVGGSPAESQGLPMQMLAQVQPNGSAVVAFDKKTGKELYRVGNDLASYASMSVQTVQGKPTGLAFLRSGLLAFDPSNGKEIHSYPWRADFLESVNASVPVTDGQRVFVSESYQVGSTLLDAKAEPWTEIWKDKGARNRLKFRAHWATPVLIDGYLYGCNGRNEDDSDFRCIRLEDGKVQWTERRHERSSVTFVDGYLIVLGEQGNLDLVRPNPEKLEVIAHADLSNVQSAQGGPLLEWPCWAAPAVSHGLLFIRGKDRLVCMQLMKN